MIWSSRTLVENSTETVINQKQQRKPRQNCRLGTVSNKLPGC